MLMDLSFTLKRRTNKPEWRVSISDIKAAADQRRCKVSFCGTPVADGLRGQAPSSDAVHALACAITPETSGLIDTVTLGGSFNPGVAYRLKVGKTE